MSAISASSEGPSSKNIPVRNVVINDPNQLPLDYGTTPGGTLFSTTPGGTRIIYERKFLLQCRQSPHSMSPPCNLPTIPGVTEPAKPQTIEEETAPKENIAPTKSAERDELFDMDM